MSTLYEKLCELCEGRGVSGYRMCKDIGIQPSLMTDLKSGRKKGFSAGTAQKIADYFGITVRDLIGEQKAFVCDTAPLKQVLLNAILADDEDNKKTALQTESGNENEKEFMNLFLQLSPEEQLRELSYLREIVNRKGM